MFVRKTGLLMLVGMLFGASGIGAQDTCISYKLIPQTTYRTEPVTMSQWVDETVMEAKQVTSWKPVWTREQRERRTTVLKPIVETSEREERYLVRRPIVETSYRERQVEETSYETVTEMREQRWLVEKPVVETQYREEQVVVQKPVTSTLMQTENITTLKPVTVSETQYVAGATIQNELALETGRNRLRWLQPGYYVNPATGQAVYRGRGFHLVPDQQLALRPTIEPTLIPQVVERTTYATETVQVQKPVQVTQYVEQIETRKVPVQVTRTSQEIQVTQTPVTVQKPVTRIRTEKIPVEEVSYVEEILTRRVPVTETRYERVEQVEPYAVEVCKWVAETSEIRVPTTVRRRVDYTMNQVVPTQVMMRVPVDAWGNVVAAPSIVPVQQQAPQIVARYPIADRILSAPISESYQPLHSGEQTASSAGDVVVVRKLGADEYRDLKPADITIPETQTDPSQPSSPTTVLKRPTPAETTNDADDKDRIQPAAERSPSLDRTEPQSPDDRDSGSNLKIDSNEAADINTRPDQSRPADEDELQLEGSNP